MKHVIEKLEQCKSYNQKIKFLRSLGRTSRGGGRICIKINNKILKVAYNLFGEEQNRNEIETYLGLKKHHRKYFATIFKYDIVNYSWIIQEQLHVPRYEETRIKLNSQNLKSICNLYNLDYWELRHQVGIDKKRKPKVYDYGF